jgi:hypothetical protein
MDFSTWTESALDLDAVAHKLRGALDRLKTQIE